MPTEDGKVPIRSFRVCFEHERRLHKIDRWHIPLPYGVPLRGIVYAAVALLAVTLVGRLPVIAQPLDALPAGVRYILLPLGSAYLLTQWRLDGRSAHVAALAWLRHQLSPRRVCAFRAQRAPATVRFGPVTAAGGEVDARSRRGEVIGPATVVMRYPTRFETHGRTLRAHRVPGGPLWQGKQVNLAEGQRMVIL
jgi:hypothetical protein